MPATFDKILGKPLLHTHQASDITGLTVSGDTVSTITSNQVLTSTSANVILVDASTGAITVTLPAVSTVIDKIFTIKKIDSSSNIITIVPNATDTIESLAESLILEFPSTSVQLIGNAAGWFIV